MMSFEALAELFSIAAGGDETDPTFREDIPNRHSIGCVGRTLGIELPDSYIRIAKACRSYRLLLNGIGDNFSRDLHILNMNRVFRDELGLPSHFVLVNHGHDLDCDCLDTREKGPTGEHPVVYVDLESESFEPSGYKFATFREYLEFKARYFAPRAYSEKGRRRAAQILESLKLTENA